MKFRRSKRDGLNWQKIMLGHYVRWTTTVVLFDRFCISHAGDNSGDSFVLLVSDGSQEAGFLWHDVGGSLLDTAAAFFVFHYGDLVNWD